MTLFPMTAPRLGLSITPDSACLVQIQRQWGRKVFRQLAHQPFPEDLIHLSPTKPNISDPKVLTDVLGVLTKPYKKTQAIVLSLPDICGRTALFEFHSFPKKTADQEAILSWRFQQDLNLSTRNARLGFRVYEPPMRKPPTSTQSRGVTRVLATVLPHPIIEQYETACLKAGLLPLGVGLSSFDVFDLFCPMIQETAQIASRRSHRDAGNSFFLYLAGWGFSFIALKEGCPVFLRVKALRLNRRQEAPSPPDEAALKAQAPATGPIPPRLGLSETSPSGHNPLPQNSPSSSATPRMLTNELVATLQYYLESFQAAGGESQSLPLYVAESMEEGTTLFPEIQGLETMLLSSLVDSPPITLLPLSDRLRKSLPRNQNLTPYTYQKALPAYASVVVAS